MNTDVSTINQRVARIYIFIPNLRASGNKQVFKNLDYTTATILWTPDAKKL